MLRTGHAVLIKIHVLRQDLKGYAGEEVLIPRIKIKHQDELFIYWNRRQFSVTPDFAVTIIKCQDQTQRKVGVL